MSVVTFRGHLPVLPFFILTENNDLATEYEYRYEGMNDYITAPVNIPELIRRVLFFVE
nr:MULTISPECIES: response regulator [Clostridia]